MYYFMDSGPKFTGLVRLNAGGIARGGSCVKSVQILHVFCPPQFFRGGPPEFLDLDYLFRVDSNHVVKFRGDRPRELGGPLANKKNK